MDGVTKFSTANKLIHEAAEKENCVAMLASFPPEYLDYAFTVEADKESSSQDLPEVLASKVVSYVKRVFDSLEAFNKVRRNMDRALFTQLMKSDNFFVSSGTDKEKGRKISFFRYGSLYKGKYLPTWIGRQLDTRHCGYSHSLFASRAFTVLLTFLFPSRVGFYGTAFRCMVPEERHSKSKRNYCCCHFQTLCCGSKFTSRCKRQWDPIASNL